MKCAWDPSHHNNVTSYQYRDLHWDGALVLLAVSFMWTNFHVRIVYISAFNTRRHWTGAYFCSLPNKQLNMVTPVVIIETTILEWGYEANFPRSVILPIVRSYQNTGYLPMECHVHIWQISQQLIWGDICQIWMWFKDNNMCFGKIENFPNRELNERSFNNPNLWWSLVFK